MPKKIETFRSVPADRYEKTDTRKEDKAFYAGARWKKLSKIFKLRNPICQCDDNCGQPAEQVHHIIDRKERPDLAYEWKNLQSLTRSCHSKITRQRQGKN